MKNNESNRVIELYKQGYSCNEIGKELGFSHEKARYILKRNDIFTPIYKKSIINITFLLTDSEERNYFIGLLLSDGHIDFKVNRISIKLKSSDKDVLEKLSEVIGKNITITSSKKRKSWIIKNNKKTKFESSETSMLRFSSKDFVNYLADIGITENKTYTLQIPNEFEKCKHFWRGMIDGDGCIYYRNNILQLSIVGTKNVCEKFKSFCMFFVNTKAKIYKQGNVYTFRITSSKALKILYILYNGSIIHLYRKYNKYIDVIKNYNFKLRNTLN